MQWETPPIIKIHEALGAVADNRIGIEGNSAKVYSSSGNKFYTVTFDPETNSIMTNDNGSYWKGYLGYPAIAYLMKINKLPYNPDVAMLLSGIAWKDINQKFKNDFDKTLEYILSDKTAEQKEEIDKFVQEVFKVIKDTKYKYLGSKTKPPEGY